MKNANQPITPCIMQKVGNEDYRLSKGNGDPKEWQAPMAGLTKREHMATQILSGLCANYLRENVTGWDVKTYVVEAITLTDMLLDGLEKIPVATYEKQTG